MFVSIFDANHYVILYFAFQALFYLNCSSSLCSIWTPVKISPPLVERNTLSHTHITFKVIQRQTPCCSALMEPSARSQTGSSCSHGLIPAAEPWHRERQTIWPPSHRHSSGSQQGLVCGVCVCVCDRKRERQVTWWRCQWKIKDFVCSNVENIRHMHRGSICSQIVCSMNFKGVAFNKWDIFPLYSLHIDRLSFVLPRNRGYARRLFGQLWILPQAARLLTKGNGVVRWNG